MITAEAGTAKASVDPDYFSREELVAKRVARIRFRFEISLS